MGSEANGLCQHQTAWLAGVQVRMVPQKPGIAFCEYQSDVQSTVAMQGLQGFKLATDKAMKITYARQ